MSPEDFDRILTLLSSDPEEAARLYAILHSKLAGFFRMKGISDPEAAADETIDRAVVKLAAGASIPDIARYCFGIARNIAKERRRQMRREIDAFQGFVNDTEEFPTEQVERINELLKPCFEELTQEDQELLRTYCKELQGRARAEHRRQLAEMMQLTVLALRIRVTRLRTRLTDCVKKQQR